MTVIQILLVGMILGAGIAAVSTKLMVNRWPWDIEENWSD